MVTRIRIFFRHHCSKPLSKLPRDPAMTFQAERAQVVEIAFTSAFHHRHNVVGVPKTLALSWLQAPIGERPFTAFPSQSPDASKLGDTVDPAHRADSSVTEQHLVSQITRI
jgi:hypothetical protein